MFDVTPEFIQTPGKGVFLNIGGGGGEKLPHPFFVLSLLIISSSVFPYPGGGRGGFKNFPETKWGKKRK